MSSELDEAAFDRARARLACALVAYAFRSESAAEDYRSTRRITFTRQVAMYLLHIAFGISLARVAQAFGRDRSTAAYACQKVEDAREDPTFDSRLCALEDALRSTPAPVPPTMRYAL